VTHFQNFACAQQKRINSVVVSTIKNVSYSIERSNPANLLVTLTATLPSGGYSDFVLSRAVYKKPPKDGIQDYYFQATPPSGPATQALIDKEASNRWIAFPGWVTGVRIHGMGDGVRVRTITEQAPKPVQIVGRSQSSNLNEALANALKKLIN